MIRLALNTRTLAGLRAGIGHYTFELATGLAAHPDVRLFCFSGANWEEGMPVVAEPRSGFVGQPSQSWAANIPGAYALRRVIEQHRFNAGTQRNSVDLYHEPSLWPLEFNGPTVMTVHDLCHVVYPETQPNARIRYMQKVFPKALARCVRIITDTESVRQEILTHFDIAPESIRTVPLGVSPRFHARTIAKSRLPADLHPGRYFLCVGTLEPRKNLPLVLQAHARLSASDQLQYPLVVVGGRGWKDSNLLKLCERNGVIRLGYVNDESLAEIVAGATALLFPSLYEGFGLPVLEAMASGTHVVLAGVSSPMEVAGAAAIVASPDNPVHWKECMQMLIEQPAHFEPLRQAGIERAREFTWQRCINETIAVYRSVLE